MKLAFFRDFFSGLLQSRYVREYFCELLGSVILFACLVWGFVASLVIILVIHNNEFSLSHP